MAELASGGEDMEATTELYRITVRAAARAHDAARGPALRKTAIGFRGTLVVEFEDDAVHISAGETRTWVAERPHTYAASGLRGSWP